MIDTATTIHRMTAAALDAAADVARHAQMAQLNGRDDPQQRLTEILAIQYSFEQMQRSLIRSANKLNAMVAGGGELPNTR